MTKQTIVKGQTLRIKSTVYSDDGVTPANITAALITTMIKKSYKDIDANAVLTKTQAAGVTITSGVNGTCETLFTAAETLTFQSGSLFYEILVKLASGEHIRSGAVEFIVDNNLIKALN